MGGFGKLNIYRVKQGDTLLGISQSFGVPLQFILSYNGITEDQGLVVGQELFIPTPRVVYTAKQGDTLYTVAQSFGTSVKKLLANNPILGGNPIIYTGQSLIIENEGQDDILNVNGYTYTFVADDVLRKTLPYLDYLTVFTYGFTEEGGLIPENDTELTERAESYGVKTLLLVSTLGEDGQFNNNLSSMIFQNETAENRLISELVNAALQKGYDGVEVDFEYIPREDREGYLEFLSKLKSALFQRGLELFVALAPKTGDDMEGLLYEGHDYAGIGAIADRVILMTYEWGYKYGPPGVVAPVNRVEEVVLYAVSRIPREKILLGVPNYGYDWPLPFVKGQTEAQGISNEAAVALAREKGVNIQFDERSASPYFSYTENGTEHIVWFENATSINEKLTLAREYGLFGISIWNIMRFFPQLYDVANDY